MAPDRSDPAGDPSEGDSDASADISPTEKIAEIDEQIARHVTELQRLQEARDKLEPRAPNPFIAMNDANVPVPIDPNSPTAFRQLVGKGKEKSEYRDVMEDLAERVSNEITLYVQRIFARRIQELVRALNATTAELAARACFPSEVLMHQNITQAIQQEILAEYLRENPEEPGTPMQEMILPTVAKIESLIDEMLIPAEELKQLPAHTTNESVLNIEERDLFKKRTIYHFVWLILQHSALTPDQKELPMDKKRPLMEAYTWANAGMSFDELTKITADDVAETMKHTGSAVSARDIRHNCGNKLGVYFGNFKTGNPLSDEVRREKILKAESERAFKQCSLELLYIEQGKLGKKAYRPLKDKERAFTKGVTVRLMGHNENGIFTPDQLRADILSFQGVEQNLTRWMEPLLGQPNRGYLQPEEAAGIETFMEHGGHASRFTSDQIEFIQYHGVVLMLELQIREDVKIVLGTISALSRALCAPKHGTGDSVQWHNQEKATKLLPQYDVRDLDFTNAVDEKERERFFAKAGRQMHICRSSMIETLNKENFPQLEGVELPEGWENITLRRMGLVALLKCIVLLLGKDWGKDSVTFNIGTIVGMGYLGINNPSLHHNSYASPFVPRKLYTPIKDGINISWMAYKAEIEDAIDEVCRIIYGKQSEWNLQKIEALKAQLYMQLDMRFKAGLHAPF